MASLSHFGAWMAGFITSAGLLVLFFAVYAVWRYQTARRMKEDPDFANHRLAGQYFRRAKAEHRRGRRVSAQAYYEMACDLDSEYRSKSPAD